jgi:FtsZ-interacting cell division protein ZipA
MDTVIIVFITVVLLGLVAVTLWNKQQKEGMEVSSYNEQTCLTLAQKNSKRIEDLEAQMKAIIVMQDEVGALKSQNDANTTNLSKTIETCKK